MIIARGSSNGINLHRFNITALKEDTLATIKASVNFSNDKVYLLCIGRLVKDKGIVELVNVFNELRKEHQHLILILVGEYEASLDPLPEKTLHEIKTNPAIIHIPWTDHVEYYMHIANYFVFPSHREGFPNVLLQAGAMGLPIVCSNIAGNIDIVKNNETGLIFDRGNEQQLLNLMQYALTHPQHLQTMAKNLEQEIQENYRQENIWKNMLEAYKSLVNLNNKQS